ncbi:MAG TPA: GntR family transcriptional regulator [Burkholderiales bacterium]|nr:GntR family transcriptional regulator [Burkholderiales bacterium]
MSQEYAFPVDRLGELDATSFVPLYMQLANRIATLIRERGEHAVGKVLPSEAECVSRLRVSRPTVRQAMSHLLSQGLILREKGRGTFVAPLKLEHDVSHAFEDDMRAAHRRVDYRRLTWNRIDATPELAAIFGGEPGHELFLLRRLRSVEDELIDLEERYLPGDVGRLLSERDVDSTPAVELVQQVTHHKLARLEMEVSSIAASREIAAVLQVKAGAPLLRRRTTFFSDSAQPLLHGMVTSVAEHYRFRFSISFSGRALPPTD